MTALAFAVWKIGEWFFLGTTITPDWNEIIRGIFAVAIVTATLSAWLVRHALKNENRHATEIEAINKKLHELAMTDAVTGVSNHRHFEIALEQEWHKMQRLHHPLSCVMIDIDNFKKINDEYGHQAGDTVLRQLAQLLLEEFREIDIISRYGGEEFTAILIEKPGHLAGLRIVIERIRQRIAETEFHHAGRTIRITASIGGALVPDSRVTTPDELVRAADQAMYAAKLAGKNCCRLIGEK